MLFFLVSMSHKCEICEKGGHKERPAPAKGKKEVRGMDKFRRWRQLIRMDSRWKTASDFTEEAELTIKAAIGIMILNAFFTATNIALYILRR